MCAPNTRTQLLLLPDGRDRFAAVGIGRPGGRREHQSRPDEGPDRPHGNLRPFLTLTMAASFPRRYNAVMPVAPPFNLQRWIEQHRGVLKPPVGNKLLFQDSTFIIMAVAVRIRARIITMTQARSFSSNWRETCCSKRCRTAA